MRVWKKALDVYGSDIERFSIQAVNNMRTLGVLGLRICTTFGSAKGVLATYYKWSDVVLELYVNDRGKSIIKAIKTPTVMKSVEIPDDVFCRCLSTSPGCLDLKEQYHPPAQTMNKG